MISLTIFYGAIDTTGFLHVVPMTRHAKAKIIIEQLGEEKFKLKSALLCKKCICSQCQ
jgi:hypothetical protein